MGAINSVRRLTIQSLGLLEALEPTTIEIATKADATTEMECRIQAKWPHLSLVPFGSSENGFGCGTSDLDVGLFFDSSVEMDALSWNDRIQILASVGFILTADGGVELRQFITHARVPLLKLWDIRRKLAIDVSIGSPLAVLNTNLLKRYGELDPRVRPLVFAVKYWAKQRGINDAANGSLSSYAWIMLVIFFLQTRGLLPCLNASEIAGTAPSNASNDSPRHSMYNAPDESVGSLLVAFFHYYAWEFDYRNLVVSIRSGCALPKQGKWGLGLGTWRFSIEDPLELHHDVGRVIFHPKGQERLMDELRRAAALALLPTCQLDDLCAALSPEIKSMCFICMGHGHAPRDCTAEAGSSPSTSVCSTPTKEKEPLVSEMQAVPPQAKVLAKKRPRRRTKSKGGAAKKKFIVSTTVMGY
ncbi:unnamed protein product [Aphanomyces euteiches]